MTRGKIHYASGKTQTAVCGSRIRKKTSLYTNRLVFESWYSFYRTCKHCKRITRKL